MFMSFAVNHEPSYIYIRSIDASGSGHFIERLGFLEYGIMIEDRKGRRIFFAESDEYNTRISEWDRAEMEKYARRFGYPVEELKEIKEAFSELVKSF